MVATPEQAGARSPDPGVLLAEGIAHHNAGRLDDAERSYAELLTYLPEHPQALHLQGLLAGQRCDWETAARLFDRALAGTGAPDDHNADLYNNAAIALREVKRLLESHNLLQELLARYPERYAAWHNLAQTFRDANRLDEAAAAIRRAVSLAPDFGASRAVLGEILTRQGRLHSAVAAYRRAHDLGYATIETISGLGNSLRLLGHLAEAITTLREALRVAPAWPPTWSNLAIALAQVGDFEESLALHDHAITLDPANPVLRANRSHARLSSGDIAGGWDDWEWGMCDAQRGRHRVIDAPIWDGEQLDGRTVMVYREQGVGDEVLFASCYADLIARVGPAGHAIVECDPRLEALFTRSFPEATVRAQRIDPTTKKELDTEPDFDLTIPAGSLPRFFRRSLADFPRRTSFLQADPALVSRWCARLAGLGDGARVGVSWRSLVQTAERRLEYSLLHEWEPVFSLPGVHLVNLQYDDCERELRDAEHRFGITIHRWDDLDLKDDFDGVAALVSQLDLVLAPRNSVAMLAGALGTPTVMTGNRWDWSDLGSDASPWFPSVDLVYRHVGEDWDAVLAEAGRRVSAVARRASSEYSDTSGSCGPFDEHREDKPK